jgi:hypothetical protein
MKSLSVISITEVKISNETIPIPIKLLKTKTLKRKRKNEMLIKTEKE